MSKYIDSEKLIDMIDNSIAYCQINYSDDYALGFEQSLREVKNFITYLQQEQPVADLEKELENFARQYPMEHSGSYRNLMTLARHFYELGRNAKKEE